MHCNDWHTPEQHVGPAVQASPVVRQRRKAHVPSRQSREQHSALLEQSDPVILHGAWQVPAQLPEQHSPLELHDDP